MRKYWMFVNAEEVASGCASMPIFFTWYLKSDGVWELRA